MINKIDATSFKGKGISINKQTNGESKINNFTTTVVEDAESLKKLNLQLGDYRNTASIIAIKNGIQIKSPDGFLATYKIKGDALIKEQVFVTPKGITKNLINMDAPKNITETVIKQIANILARTKQIG